MLKGGLTEKSLTAFLTDSMGNPLNYYTDGMNGEANGTLEWNGRQLSAVTIDDERYEGKTGDGSVS